MNKINEIDIYDTIPKKLAEKCITDSYYVAITIQEDGEYLVIDTTQKMTSNEREYKSKLRDLIRKFNSISKWNSC